MTNDDLVRLYVLIESRIAVDEWVVDGIRIWPLVRAQIMIDNFFMYRRKRQEGAKRRRLPLGPLEGVARHGAAAARAMWRDRDRNDRLHEVDALLYSDGVSFLKLNGRHYDRFCDPLRERLTAKGMRSLMLTPLGRCHTPRHGPSVFVQPAIDLAHLHGIVASRVRRSPELRIDGWEEAMALAREAFPSVRLREASHFARATTYVRSFDKLYDRILARTRPSVIFIVSYYGAEAMALIRACRRRGIATVDVQHGCINDAHWAYARWTRLPREGFELLPSYFWVWSTTEEAVIRSWSDRSHGAHAPLVGGNLFLAMWRDGSSPIVAGIDARVMAIQDRAPGHRHVLYTTNGFETEAELARLRGAIERSRDDLFWWVRLHPAAPDSRELVERELGRGVATNYRVDDGKDLPLYGVLRHVSAHVTEASSTVIEAAALGVPTVLLSRREAVMYEDLLTRRWALVIDPEDDLVDKVRSRLGQRGEAAQSDPGRIDPLELLLEPRASADRPSRRPLAAE